MTGISRTLRAFTARDLVTIAVFAALGVAVKPVVVPLAHLVSAPLLIPAGAAAGGLYMMWLVVGMGVVGKPGSATLIALVQALLVMLTGVVGSHGAFSLISYTTPGIAIDLALLLIGHRACCLRCCFLSGIVANVTGTLMVSLVFFRLPATPLVLTLCTAALSGGIGGVLAWHVVKALRRHHIGMSPAGGATGVNVVALGLLCAALVLGASACSSRADGAAAGSPAARPAPARIPVILADAGANTELSVPAAFVGEHVAADEVPLAQALAAGAGGSSAQVAVYLADGSLLRLPSADCSLTPFGSVRLRGAAAGPVAGIVVDPPPATITDVRRLAEEAVAAGDGALIIYLDGFGWDQYVAAREAGRIPAMEALTATPALTVFPTITPVTFAAMVSGEDPSVTGVRDRSTHRAACPTVFTWAEQRGLSTSLVEGDVQVLALTENTVLNSDSDGDGLTDGEVFAAAKRRLARGRPDLMLVHFHGIDDVAHAAGPFAAVTERAVADADAMVGALLRLWSGRVIVVADHGLHAVPQASAGEGRGQHGDFRAEDLIIPILTDGAK